MVNSREFRALAEAHRRALARLTQRRGAVELKALYERATAEMLRKLRASTRHLGTDAFTSHQARMIVAQLREGERILAGRMAGELKGVAREAQVEAATRIISDIEKLEPLFDGAGVRVQVEQAARFAGLRDDPKRSILREKRVEAEVEHDRLVRIGETVPRRIENVLSRYSLDTIEKMENNLALSVLENETPLAAMDRLEDFVDGEWWRAERIVRTETSFAYSSEAAATIEEAAEEVDGLMMQWHEYADDDGSPLDDRVAADSLAMAGQVVEAGQPFFCPSTALQPTMDGETQVPKSLAGEWVEAPPNRPNDRATVTAWRKDWGMPGWRWSGGRRVWLVKPGG